MVPVLPEVEITMSSGKITALPMAADIPAAADVPLSNWADYEKYQD